MADVRSTLSLLTAGILGGAVALGAGAVVDDSSSTTTVAATPPVQTVTITRTQPGTTAQVAESNLTPVGEIAQRALPGVVLVTTSEASSLLGGQVGATGSGFVVDPAGYVVTNDHVVEDATKVTVSFEDSAPIDATVVGTDPDSDLALLKIDLPAGRQLTALPLGDSDAVKVGDPTIAIGSPFGFDQTVTTGIVSAVGRSIESQNQQFNTPGAIQTDAAINPGNSGGPLLNDRGEVIGVNSQIRGESRQNSGIGFAVPSNLVKRVVDSLRHEGTVRYAYMGIVSSMNARGEVVIESTGATGPAIVPGGPAEQAGLREGDQILSVDGTPVHRTDDIGTVLSQKRPGDRVDVVVRRGGAEQTIPVTLGERPHDQP